VRLPPERLAAQLREGLAPVYLVHGEEPLQAREALDSIRAAARAAGFGERMVFAVDASFDWSPVHGELDSLSLFAARRVLELRLGNGRLGRDGGGGLRAAISRAGGDTLLLAGADKLESEVLKSAWYRDLEAAGVVVETRNLPLEAMAPWLHQRARTLGLELADDAAGLIADRTEGNLLAAEQELEKLRLVHGAGTVGAAEALDAVLDSARHDIFQLAEAALAGDPARTARICAHLRGEGTAEPLVLWALARSVRVMNRLAAASADENAIFQAEKVFDGATRRACKGAARRLGRRLLGALLEQLHRADRAVKGRLPGGDGWLELERLALALAGALPPAPRD
jgi:DNA polymerase-3 subunit delta